MVKLTGDGNYFEDFTVGDVHEHCRGRTIEQFDNYMITHMSLNTAQAHFNLPYSQALLDGSFPERLVVGLCTLGIVVGLTTEDMSENALAEVGMDAIRIPNPVFAEDTLHARSEVLALWDNPERANTGFLRYRFTGINQHGKTVIEGERTILLKKQAYDEGSDA